MKGEWPVSYHGTSQTGAEAIIEGHYKVFTFIIVTNRINLKILHSIWYECETTTHTY